MGLLETDVVEEVFGLLDRVRVGKGIAHALGDVWVVGMFGHHGCV